MRSWISETFSAFQRSSSRADVPPRCRQGWRSPGPLSRFRQNSGRRATLRSRSGRKDLDGLSFSFPKIQSQVRDGQGAPNQGLQFHFFEEAIFGAKIATPM